MMTNNGRERSVALDQKNASVNDEHEVRDKDYETKTFFM